MKDLKVLNALSAAVAVFDGKSHQLIFFNGAFKQLTRIKQKPSLLPISQKSYLYEEFLPADALRVGLELFQVALETGTAYDSERQLRKFPAACFPAELHLTRIGTEDHPQLLLEVCDLSLNKLHLELQRSHEELKSKIAALMSARAELRHSERVQVLAQISEFIADKLLGPLLVCRQTLAENLKQKNDPNLERLLRISDEVKDSVVWLRELNQYSHQEIYPCSINVILGSTLQLQMNSIENPMIKESLRRLLALIEISESEKCILSPIQFVTMISAVFDQLSSAAARLAEISISINNKHPKFFSLVIDAFVSENNLQEQKQIYEKDFLQGQHPENVTIEHSTVRNRETLIIHLSKVDGVSKGKIESELYGLAHLTAKQGTEEDLREVRASFQSRNLEGNQNHLNYKGTVIVIDDDPDVRALIGMALRKTGFVTEMFENGKDALQKLSQKSQNDMESIAVVVCDVRMPKMSGPDFFLDFRKLHPRTPFVFFSSHNLSDLSSEFNDENLYFLTKDKELENLLILVDRLSDERSSQAFLNAV